MLQKQLRYFNHLPGPCSGKKFISILVTDDIQKRRREPGQALELTCNYNY